MNHRIYVYGTTPATALTMLETPVIRIERWSKRVNAPGQLVFSIKATNPEATSDTLKMFRRVLFCYDGVPDWTGFILDTQQVEDRIEVICAGMLEFFNHRRTGSGETFNGQGSTKAFDLLSSLNLASDTGVTEGTDGVTATCNLQAQGRLEALKMWEMIAAATGGEFEIDASWALNFVPSLGSDKSGTVELIYKRDGSPGTNVNDVKYGESGREMVNKLYGSNGTLSSMKQSLSSQDLDTGYGLLEDVKQFSEAQDQSTLDALTQAEVDQRNTPLTSLEASPQLEMKTFNALTGMRETRGLAYGDLLPGDIVTFTRSTENDSMTEARRVAEVVVEMDENGREKLSLTLSKTGVFITAGYLDATRVEELTKRIKSLEQQL